MGSLAPLAPLASPGWARLVPQGSQARLDPQDSQGFGGSRGFGGTRAFGGPQDLLGPLDLHGVAVASLCPHREAYHPTCCSSEISSEQEKP